MGPSTSDLRTVSLFRGFEDNALTELGELFTRLIVDDSVPLFEAGTPATSLYLLTQGEVVLEHPGGEVFRGGARPRRYRDPVSGTVVRAGDDRITLVLDLLIDSHAAILEGYLTRVQLLDILV